MTSFARAKHSRRWAAVAALGILVIAGLESYALTQGINGSALTASLGAIAVLGGFSAGRWLK